MDTEGESVAEPVDAVENLIQAILAKAHDMKDRPEHLALEPLEPVDLEGARGNEAAFRAIGTEADLIDQLALAHHPRRMSVQHRLGFAVDHRTDIGREQTRIADPEFRHRTRQHLQQLAGDILLHAENAQRRAALARTLERGDQHVAHHLFRQGG